MNAAANDPFLTAVHAALELSPTDQQRLAQLLQPFPGGQEGQDADLSTNMAEADEFDEGALNAWIAVVAGQRPWDQLQLLDEAVAQATDERERQLLTQRRRVLVEENPAIAIRAGVESLAARSPGAVVFGLIGLILAIVSAGAWIFHRIF